jgi:hypothetical protein
MTTRRAECSCGQLSATCSGQPYRLSVCHCLACKRKTGSAFGFGAGFPRMMYQLKGMRPNSFVSATTAATSPIAFARIAASL